MKEKQTYVELFAGCGGLSLGLESKGWSLELANELSPMASETFAYNHLGWSQALDASGTPVANVEDLNSVDAKLWLQTKLVVGDVVTLVDQLRERPELLERLDGVDLISGGPPCQGFSMAGKRVERDQKNRLPYAFVDLVELVQPRMLVLENVEGITRAFKHDGGSRVPWVEIAKAFAQVGYAPIAFLLNAKFFGVPQSRPRFIMIGVRKDQEEQVLMKLEAGSAEAKKVYSRAFSFVKDHNVPIEVITMDGELGELQKRFCEANLFPEMTSHLVTVKEAIEDLKCNGVLEKGGVTPYSKKKLSPYVAGLNRVFHDALHTPHNELVGLRNHELRKHQSHIRLRFRLSQIAAAGGGDKQKELSSVIAGRAELSSELLSLLWEGLSDSKELVHEDLDIHSPEELELYLPRIRSKKQIQRPLNADRPAPAQLTIPDDLCHYDSSVPRVLTVREMARIQSFPDGFVFRSKATTGGGNRKNEVPQYTQVGNAVPPLLGRAIASLAQRLLSSEKKVSLD